MTTTLAFLTILGACLGLRCPVRVLALASIATAAVVTVVSTAAGPFAVAATVAAAVLMLQVGYFAGLMLQVMGHAGAPEPVVDTAAAGRAAVPAPVRIERSRPG